MHLIRFLAKINFKLSLFTFCCLLISLSARVSGSDFNQTEQPSEDFSESLSQQETVTDKAHWEFGGGFGTLIIDHYLGSDESESYTAPLPYIVYDGDFLKADRKGVRGVFYQTDKVEFNLSLKVNLPVDSDDNKARESMPDLDPLLEIGPAFKYALYQGKVRDQTLSFQLAFRAAFSFDQWQANHQGWIVNPSLNFSHTADNWQWNMGVGPIFAERQYQQYFYQVKPQFETLSRSRYQAKKGLIATRLSSNVSFELDDWRFGGFVQYYNLNSAANLDSPLVNSQNNFNLGIFVVRVFKGN